MCRWTCTTGYRAFGKSKKSLHSFPLVCRGLVFRWVQRSNRDFSFLTASSGESGSTPPGGAAWLALKPWLLTAAPIASLNLSSVSQNVGVNHNHNHLPLPSVYLHHLLAQHILESQKLLSETLQSGERFGLSPPSTPFPRQFIQTSRKMRFLAFAAAANDTPLNLCVRGTDDKTDVDRMKPGVVSTSHHSSAAVTASSTPILGATRRGRIWSPASSCEKEAETKKSLDLQRLQHRISSPNASADVVKEERMFKVRLAACQFRPE